MQEVQVDIIGMFLIICVTLEVVFRIVAPPIFPKKKPHLLIRDRAKAQSNEISRKDFKAGRHYE